MTERMQKTGHKESSYVRPSEQWHCGMAEQCRLGPNASGLCLNNDAPCSPIRSVKSNRKWLWTLLFATVIAICAIAFSTNSLFSLLSPGPLSVGHAEVASCQDCHSASDEPMSNWLHKALTLSSNNDDQMCLNCHELGANAFAPHSTAAINMSSYVGSDSTVSTTAINSVSNSQQSDWRMRFAKALNDREMLENKDVSCASCHREHQGEFAPLDGFDSQQCHSCHKVTFDEIQHGHPEYTQYPHVQETRIKFDHVSHLENYFLEDEFFDVAPEGCLQCHATDQTGEWMLAQSFEQSCSSCHLSDVLGDNRADAKGIAVLSVPELDIQTLKQRGFNIGYWPKWADGELTPIMSALLNGSNDVFQVDVKAQLFDLSTASDEELAAATELAWQIKELFYAIQSSGAKELNQRLRNSFGESLDQSTLNHLIASLPRDTLLNNQQEWFPDLMQEMKDYRSGAIELRMPVDTDAGLDKPAIEHVDITAQDDILTEDDNILTEDDDILTEDDDILTEDDDILTEDDDILTEDDDILTEDYDILDEGDDILAEEDDTNKIIVAKPLLELADNETWALNGGWYRDGSSIRYRPSDHADLFFKAWLDVSSSAANDSSSKVFKSLTRDDSVGSCIKCHSVETAEQVSAEFANVQWHSFKPEDVKVDFNRFSHVSHFSLMNDDGCSSCHLLNEDSLEHTANSGNTYSPSFVSMDTQTCTQCHQKGRAPDNCLTCHNYHVEPVIQSKHVISDTLKGVENE